MHVTTAAAALCVATGTIVVRASKLCDIIVTVLQQVPGLTDPAPGVTALLAEKGRLKGRKEGSIK